MSNLFPDFRKKEKIIFTFHTSLCGCGLHSCFSVKQDVGTESHFWQNRLCLLLMSLLKSEGFNYLAAFDTLWCFAFSLVYCCHCPSVCEVQDKVCSELIVS